MLGKLKYVLYKTIVDLSNAMSRKHLDGWLDDELDKEYARVLTVGSAGPVTSFLRSKSDLNLDTLDINPDKSPDILCDLTNMHVVENNTYDCVVVLEVLEHVLDPKMALSEIYRVLVPGGKLILSTPFIFHIHAEPHDYWRFTHYGLQVLLSDYNNVNIRQRNGGAESLVVSFARMAKGKFRPRIREFFMVPFAALLWPIAIIYDFFNPDDRSTSGYFVTANK